MSESYGRSPHRARDLDELLAWCTVLPPGSSFTHLTAAEHRGWWLPRLPRDVPVFVSVSDRGTRPRRAGLHVTRHSTQVGHRLLAGLPIADPAEVLLAAACHLAVLDLVVLGDGALHLGDVTAEELVIAASRRRRGALALRAALPWMDGRSESPGETLLRLLHSTCRVQVEVQAPIRDEYDQLIARADLRIVGTKRLAEYNGAHHREAGQYERDRERDRRLQALGWSPYSYSAITVLRQPHLILRDADEALGRASDPGLLETWLALVQDSTYTTTGMARLGKRLGLVEKLAG